MTNIEKIRALTNEGLSTRAIARELKIARRTVEKIQIKYELPRRRRRAFTEDEIVTAIRMFAEGASRSAVAQELGRHTRSVADRFPGQCWTPEQMKQYRDLTGKSVWRYD